MIEIKPTDWHVDVGYGPHFCCAFVPSPPQPFDIRLVFKIMGLCILDYITAPNF